MCVCVCAQCSGFPTRLHIWTLMCVPLKKRALHGSYINVSGDIKKPFLVKRLLTWMDESVKIFRWRKICAYKTNPIVDIQREDYILLWKNIYLFGVSPNLFGFQWDSYIKSFFISLMFLISPLYRCTCNMNGMQVKRSVLQDYGNISFSWKKGIQEKYVLILSFIKNGSFHNKKLIVVQPSTRNSCKIILSLSGGKPWSCERFNFQQKL